MTKQSKRFVLVGAVCMWPSTHRMIDRAPVILTGHGSGRACSEGCRWRRGRRELRVAAMTAEECAGGARRRGRVGTARTPKARVERERDAKLREGARASLGTSGMIRGEAESEKDGNRLDWEGGAERSSSARRTALRHGWAWRIAHRTGSRGLP